MELDPRARALNPTQDLNAFIEDPALYTWNIEDFATPPLEEMVIYQLHIGTFPGRNDPMGSVSHPGGYTDVAVRVGHLVELGVNAVLVNPVTEFPGDLSAGYNPITQWAPEWAYGTPNQFKQFVDVLHQNGIAVLVDIVWNHFSPTDNYLWNYDGTQIYYDNPAVDTPWGAQADFDDPEVRAYFLDSALHWLEEMKVDGFRMDATSFMDMGAHAASGYTLMQDFNNWIDRRWKDKVAIAEELPDDPYITRPTSLGGAGFDSQYYDHFTDRLREQIGAAAFNNADMNVIADIVTGSGSWLEFSSVTNYFELHDEVWPSNGGQRMIKTIDTTFPHDDLWAKGRSKLAQGLVLFAPGVPALHQGSEWLEDTGFGTDSGDRIDWSKKTTYAGIFDYYRDAVALRTATPALFADAPIDVHHLDNTADRIAFVRGSGDEVAVVVAGFGNGNATQVRIGVPQGGFWKEALNSQATGYEGNGRTNPGVLPASATPADGYPQSITIQVPQMGLIVLVPDETTTGAGDPATTTRPLAAYPNPFSARTTVRFDLETAGPVRVRVLDLQGRVVATLVDDTRSAGAHEVAWNGRSADGIDCAGGVYFMTIESETERTPASSSVYPETPLGAMAGSAPPRREASRTAAELRP